MLTLRVLSFLVVLAIHSANKLLHVCKKRVFLIISLSRIMYHILTTGFIKLKCKFTFKIKKDIVELNVTFLRTP